MWAAGVREFEYKLKKKAPQKFLVYPFLGRGSSIWFSASNEAWFYIPATSSPLKNYIAQILGFSQEEERLTALQLELIYIFSLAFEFKYLSPTTENRSYHKLFFFPLIFFLISNWSQWEREGGNRTSDLRSCFFFLKENKKEYKKGLCFYLKPPFVIFVWLLIK